MPSFSLSSFVNYCNEQTAKKESALSTAFRQDVKAAVALAGYPTKDEIDIFDSIEGLKMTHLAEQIPAAVASYMKDENRDFEIPATDSETCAAAICRTHKDEVTKTGTSNMGGEEKEWTSTIAAHNEYFIKNRRKPFKK